MEGTADAFCVFDEHLRCAQLNTRAVQLASDLAGRTLTREDVLGRAVADVLPEFAGSDVEAQVLTAADAQRTVVFELPLGRRWFHAQVSPSLHGVTVAIREITERKVAETARRRHAKQQSALAGLARRAATGHDLQGQLDAAIDAIAPILGADLTCVAEHGRDDGGFRLRAVVGCEPEAFSAPVSLLQQAIDQGDVVVWDELCGTAAIVAPGLSVSGGMAVSVPGPEEPFGALVVLTRQRRTFDPDEVDFVRAAAAVLATAVERARRGHVLGEVREAERRRIARALQDEALQDLCHAVTLAAQPPRPGQGEPPALALLRRVGEHVRAAIHDLRLSEEESRPIGDQLEELAGDHRRLAPQWTLELRMRALPTRPLGHRGTELLRIVGEALTNARRHAEATTVTVRVWASSGCLWADVQDDGRGFDPESAHQGRDRNGLVGMRERASLVGGRVTVTSAAGEGTTVRISVPLGDRASAGERLRLLLVEDHATVREAMAAALEAEPDVRDVRQAGSLAEARTMLDDVDVAVIDLALPDGSGADVIEDVRRHSPDAQTLIITARTDRLAAADAVERGAAGVLSKEGHLHDVMAAIRRLRRGEPLMALTEVVELLRLAGQRRERELDDRRLLDSLTPREHEVLQLLADGLDNREAAARLHVSPRTHRNHVANILGKLGVHSQLQALLFALRYGVVEIADQHKPA